MRFLTTILSNLIIQILEYGSKRKCKFVLNINYKCIAIQIESKKKKQIIEQQELTDEANKH